MWESDGCYICHSDFGLWQPSPGTGLGLERRSCGAKSHAGLFAGQQRVEALQWQKARDAVASTGQPAQAAKLELMRCAAQVASLDWNSCPAYEALAQDAGKPEQAYARYLQASPQAGDIELLPEAQRAVARQLLGGGAGGCCGRDQGSAIETGGGGRAAAWRRCGA
jgi:hypothetical protein